jgi:hypothetical protein
MTLPALRNRAEQREHAGISSVTPRLLVANRDGENSSKEAHR